MPPSPPLAAGITSLPMLFWWAAAAAPILIHLWSRRKYREMPWAAMEYLLAAMRRQSRRIQLEQLLLLLIRTLVIALAVLAVAEPFLERVGFVPTSAGRTHRVLVIDGSYSMAYQPARQSRFERAKELAARIVQQSRQGDAFTLVLMSAPPKAIVGTPALEPGEVLEEIDNLQLPHTSADLSATVARVQQIVRSAEREIPGLTRHEVYFLTDLGRVGWAPDLSRAAMADFRRRSEELGKKAGLMIIDVGQPAAENIAVTELYSVEPVTVVGRSVPLKAAVKNFGRQAQSGRQVELWIDGSRAQEQTVDVPAGSEVAVDFVHRFETPGDHVVEVRAGGDSLDVDNHRFLAIPIRQSVRVLCVDGRPSGRPFEGATDYLVLALAPGRDPVRPTPVDVQVDSEIALREYDLGDFDCVFLCDVARFTSNEARLLESYLKSGGTLIFFLGNQVLAERYNRELGGGAGGQVRILPARLGAKIDRKNTAGEIARLDPLGYRHPIVAAFEDHERSGLLTADVFGYFRLILPKDTGAKVVLRAFGEPLIVEEPVHRGRVVLVATSADGEWTDLPVLPGYVPLVQELVAFSIEGQLEQRNVRVGRAIGAAIPSPATDALLAVQSPDGRSRDVPLHADGDYNAFSYDETMISGIYTARFGSPIDRTQSFAVNVDTRESDLTQLSIERLRDEIWAGVPFVHQTTWRDAEQPLDGPIVRQGWLHVALLYAVLGLLLVETFLARQFGYHSS